MVGEKFEWLVGGVVIVVMMLRCVVLKFWYFFFVMLMELIMNRVISFFFKGVVWFLLVLVLFFVNVQDMNKIVLQIFVSEVLVVGVVEIEVGKMVLEKSIVVDVKVFVKQMIDDYGKVNVELCSLVECKKLEVEDDVSLIDKVKVILFDLCDVFFDLVYVNNQVVVYEKVVELFIQVVDNLIDLELQVFVKIYLLVLKYYLEMVCVLVKVYLFK